jgi:hypothetical protein
MTMSSNATLLSISSTTEQISLLSSYTGIIKRFLIVFGSICFLWLIMGLIFASIQTFRHLKKKTNQKLFRYNRSLPPPSSLTSNGQIIKEDNISDNDDDDDLASVYTSVSFLSERSKITHEHTHFVPPCERIPEEEFELRLPTSAGISNMAYSQSTLASSNGGGASLLYYPACRNFAYSQSTLGSSTADLNFNTPTPSVIVPINDPSPSKPVPTRLVNLKRHSSQSSTTTTFSQITNATYLSSSSASTSSSIPTTSIKTMPLPTVMITDCDRLQTDIIELDDFEPEKDWRRARPELRLLLNERMPQAVR